MKRRQAIGVLGGVAAGPLVIPSAAFAELLDWGRRVRESSVPSQTAYFTSEAGLEALGHRTWFRTFEGCAPLAP